jgi:transcriptional regulator with XRE-family HTH domain
MKERIREFLLAENKSSAQMAEEIGVQPSAISHILSGRNNPSLDFVLKMFEKYDYIRTDWLLFGKGSMYKEPVMQSLFDDTAKEKPGEEEKIAKKGVSTLPDASIKSLKPDLEGKSSESTVKMISNVERIVWFYADNSFEEYFPQH